MNTICSSKCTCSKCNPCHKTSNIMIKDIAKLEVLKYLIKGTSAINLISPNGSEYKLSVNDLGELEVKPQ